MIGLRLANVGPVGAGDSSIPRRIGPTKATRMRGAVANTVALIAFDALVAAKLSLPDHRAGGRNTFLAETLTNNRPAPAKSRGAAEAI
jgi:hypothetical protein